MNAPVFSRYDSADYLKSPEDYAAYLDATIEENGVDASALAHALGVVARAQNMSRIAKETGLSREGLYRALSGEGNPSLDTVMRISAALGLELSFRPVTTPASTA
jgi:probable addiction module antidote protein